MMNNYILAGDIGGTNTNLAVFKAKKLLFSMHFKTKKLKSIIPSVKDILNKAKEKNIMVRSGCFAVAGPVKENKFCDTVNIKWKVSSKEVIKKTKLRKVVLINDFEAIGYGLNLINKKKLFVVKKGKGKGTKAIIGAGTGLGKAIIVNSTVIPSEGGHADFPAQNEFELKLVNFIKKKRRIKQVNYEELISGRGIEVIYEFLTKKKAKAEWISKNSKETMKLFIKFYARCCKNFALETLAKELYIAGGIAAKNKNIFKSKDFINEFLNVDKEFKILKEIPIYIIVNYEISLYGACFALLKRKI